MGIFDYNNSKPIKFISGLFSYCAFLTLKK